MERRAITISGIVQGVGFRPFVFRLATAKKLNGFVRNTAGSVYIEVEGPAQALDDFLHCVCNEAPTLARIESVDWRSVPVRHVDDFSIAESSATCGEQQYLSPDVAVCSDCLAELFDPTDRRYRYPFLNCTNCGPRLTIIHASPYDRAQTTMAAFEMCPECRREFEDPLDRRFHAQPIACPKCGPRLEIVGGRGRRIETVDPLATFVAAILDGKIGALKGLGGYHLVCDARSQEAVGELRRRKSREEMPLAIMVANLERARDLCEVSPSERELLDSPRRPIVLLKRRPISIGTACEAVAPANPMLGIMLPYTPLHYLLLDAAGGAPLVMTSGNKTHEPIAYIDDDATRRLGSIADVILRHNREIHVRCDDSVTRVIDGQELPIRRSRGYAPRPLHLPLDCSRPTLAVGGQLKGVFALGNGSHAFLSHHLGELDQLEACRQFERDVALYEDLFNIRPEVIVHDLHPDYFSTNYAINRAKREGLATVAVQHHHAHITSCMAEHGLTEKVIGVSLDGTGYGLDEKTGRPTIWGGEFLIGDYCSFRRSAHLRHVPMPGGEMAVRQPWRMAAAYLIDAIGDSSLLSSRISKPTLRTVRQMIERGLNSPLTSSAGRLFDAVASIAGIRDAVSYEGQAAIELEWLATEIAADSEYPFELVGDANEELPLVIDTRPLIMAIVEEQRVGAAAKQIARRFHSTLVGIVTKTCGAVRERSGLNTVVLSGGVFLNALLTTGVVAKLRAAGFEVYRHRLVPPNDGGLCLGQLAIAAAMQQASPSEDRPQATINVEGLTICASGSQAK